MFCACFSADRIMIISLQSIAMPKGLYFTLVVFWRLIFEVTKRISTKLGHIFIYECYLKNLVRTSLGIYPQGLGDKKRFWWPTLNFDRTYLCNRTWYQQFKRNFQSTGTPLHAPKFGELWSRNDWEWLANFCPPPKFSHWETLPSLPHGRHITNTGQILALIM